MDELVLQATGQTLSPAAYLRGINKSVDQVLATARDKIDTARNHQSSDNTVDMDTTIELVHGKQYIASSTQ